MNPMGWEVFIPVRTLIGVFLLNPSMAASSNPFQRGYRGWGIFIYENHAARQGNGTSWWGYLCDVCFARKKSSEREFFVPAGTHLAVKLLSCCNSINGLCGCCVYADDNFLLVTSATLVATNYLTFVTTKVRSLSYQQSLPHQGTWRLEMGRQW